MAATQQEVEKWIERGKIMKATHIISVCDTFDFDDYPVYVMPGENLESRKKQYDCVNMQRINEVIDLNE